MFGDANFCWLCNALMCHFSNYLHEAHNITRSAPTTVHPHTSPSNNPIMVQSAHYMQPTTPGILHIIISYPSFNLPSILSKILSAGWHILSCLPPSSYMHWWQEVQLRQEITPTASKHWYGGVMFLFHPVSHQSNRHLSQKTIGSYICKSWDEVPNSS